MSYQQIFDAIESVVLSVAGTVPVDTPNKFYEPPKNVDTFMRVTHLPVKATMASLGIGGQNIRPGLTQIDVFTRRGTGTSTYPDLLVQAFPRTTRFNLDDGEVFEVIAYRDGGNVVDNSFYQDRVIVSWKAITTS